MAGMDHLIDRSRGRVHVINGDIFYSPNSLRQVEVPSSSVSEKNIFNYPSVCLADFSQPRWWTAEYGWLSFVPLRPSFTGIPFDCLAYIPNCSKASDPDKIRAPDDICYQLNSNLATRWSKLDSFLLYATSSLIKATQDPILRPFSPRAFGYLRAFEYASTAHRQANLGRDWFVIWMGMLSYLIARTDNHRTWSRHDAIPTWFENLASQGFDQSWLSGIHSSTVCSFSPDTPRAGVFVLVGEGDRLQPSVEFFCDYKVPVWYPWGRKQEIWAHAHPWFAAYAPLPEQLQAATSSLVRFPSTPPHPRIGENTTKPSGLTSKEKACQTLQEFFAARTKRHAEMERRESPLERQRRLARERNPPIKGTKVFRWIPIVDPEMHLDPDVHRNQLFRSVVTADWLDLYVSKEKRYDAWENEWDLCSEFGDGESDSDQSYETEAEAVDPSLYDEPPSSPYRQSPTPPPVTNASTALTEQGDFLKLLVQYYGFVPPLTIAPNTAGAVDQEQWDKCMLAIGLRQVHGRISSSPLSNMVIDFVHKTTCAQRPGASEWDLDDNSSRALITTGRVGNIFIVDDHLFVFDFPASSTVFPWKLALTNAVDALYVCRLDSSLDQYDVARLLIEQGIAFRTLLRLRKTPSLSQSASLSRLIPIRLSGYKFTTRDYAAYQKQRDAILASPRGRAALLRGGIIWRLARDCLSFDGALQGPSIATTLHGGGFSVASSPSGDEIWDDELTPEELDLISGAYRCYTGHGMQMAIKSWWPLYSTWDLGGENYGRWTEWNEHLYRKRLQEIRDGAEPLPASKWRDRLRGPREARLVKKNMSVFSQEFLRASRRV